MAMKNSSDFNFDDLQALLCSGHGKLTDTCFMLLNIMDADVAKQWLNTAPVTSAIQKDSQHALQIAFSVNGLRKMGLEESVIKDFSDEFIIGMSGNESRT